MAKVCRMVERVAPTDVSVLLLGESGTGKELLSRALHDLGTRAAERFENQTLPPAAEPAPDRGTSEPQQAPASET
jgi:DNA-binding NtrC family response regulator